MSGSRLRRGAAATGILVGCAVLVALGFLLSNHAAGVGIRFFVFIGVAVAWNILGGMGGALSLGHAAFFGVGAYTAGWVATSTDLPIAVALAGAVLAAALSSALLVPCFRARGFYFAILTLALAEVVRELAHEWAPGGRSGIFFDPFPPGSRIPYFLALAGVAAAVAATVWIRRSRLGTALLVTRLDPVAAQDLGVNERSAKVRALAISAAFTGYFGGVFALNLGFLDPPTAFTITRSVDPVLATVLGGIGTTVGPVLGGAIWSAIGEVLNRLGVGGSFNLIFTGGILVLLTMSAPNGLHGLGTKLLGSLRNRARMPSARGGRGTDRTESEEPAAKIDQR